MYLMFVLMFLADNLGEAHEPAFLLLGPINLYRVIGLGAQKRLD